VETEWDYSGRMGRDEKPEDRCSMNKKGKDTKRYRRRWGSDGIRGDCPGPTRGKE